MTPDADAPDSSTNSSASPADAGSDGSALQCAVTSSLSQCDAGDSVTCITTCGSRGTGSCTADCQPPAATACTPPKEICNWVDDDCDGVTDPNMLERMADGARVWTAPGTSADQGTSALLPIHGGGAWLVLQGQSSEGTPLMNAIVRQKLDSNGDAVGPSQAISELQGAVGFAADSDGKWIAVETRYVSATDDSSSTKLSLFNAADFSFVDDAELTTFTDGDNQKGNANDPDVCNTAFVVDVSVFEDQHGKIRIGALHADRTGTLNTASALGCDITFSQTLRTFILSNGMLTKTAAVATGGAFSLSSAQLTRIPCRDEWMLITSKDGSSLSSPLWSTRRISSSGEGLAEDIDALTDVFLNLDFIPGESDCTSNSSPLHLLYLHNQGNSSNIQDTDLIPYLRTWKVDNATGNISRPDPDLRVQTSPLFAARLAATGGRVFAAGFSLLSEARLLEIIDSDTRVVPLTPVEQASSTSSDGIALRNFLTDGSITSIAPLGAALMTAFSRNAPTTSLNSYRQPGDTDSAVAVTYRVGCPSN